MPFLSSADRLRIEQAVADAERQTTAEFVTVFAAAADDYADVPLLAATALVFLLSGAALLLPVAFGIVEFYVAQVLAFLGLAALFAWTPLKMRLVPVARRQRRAHLLAHEQFLDLGLSATVNRTGLMLFVAAAEHYVEIIADTGLRARIDDAVWQDVVGRFVARVGENRVGDGFVEAIGACAAVLEQHFPWQPGDRNELPNRLVEL